VDKTGNESTTAASTVVLASELPSLGTTHVDEEHNDPTPFNGVKSNVTKTGSTILLTNASSAGASGTYDFAHDGAGYIDAGSTRTIRVSSAFVVTRKNTNASFGVVDWDDIPGNWDTWPGNFDDWTNETEGYSDYDVEVQVATSNDASTWSAYLLAAGEVEARYVRFRAVLSNTTANITPVVSELTATAEF
jgi:hypothetical protein